MKTLFRLLARLGLRSANLAPAPMLAKVEPAMSPARQDPGTWLTPSPAEVLNMRWQIVHLSEQLDNARHRLALAYNFDEAKSARIEELEAKLGQRTTPVERMLRAVRAEEEGKG